MPEKPITFRVTLPLLAIALLSICLVVFIRPYLQYQGIIQDVSAWGAFFTVFGVIYAIVAGFLLVTVLTRYSALGQVIEDELNAVESVRDFLVYFGPGQHSTLQSLRSALREYTIAVATVEWQQMADPRLSTNSDTSKELYAIMACTGSIKVDGRRDTSVLSAVIACVEDLAKLRTRRISLSNERLPIRLRLLLILMSLALTLGIYAVGVESLVVHAFMASTLSVSIYLLYWIIEDLDHPFYGVWNIDRSPMDELIKAFEVDGNREQS